MNTHTGSWQVWVGQYKGCPGSNPRGSSYCHSCPLQNQVSCGQWWHFSYTYSSFFSDCQLLGGILFRWLVTSDPQRHRCPTQTGLKTPTGICGPMSLDPWTCPGGDAHFGQWCHPAGTLWSSPDCLLAFSMGHCLSPPFLSLFLALFLSRRGRLAAAALCVICQHSSAGRAQHLFCGAQLKLRSYWSRLDHLSHLKPITD